MDESERPSKLRRLSSPAGSNTSSEPARSRSASPASAPSDPAPAFTTPNPAAALPGAGAVLDVPASGDGDGDGGIANPPLLSKSAQKKARRAAAREATRQARKDKKREKRAALKAERRSAAPADGGERGEGDAGGRQRQPARNNRSNARLPPALPMAIVIDAAFDDLMTDGEAVSLAGQLSRSYTAVRCGTAGGYRDGQPVRPAGDPAERGGAGGGRPLLLVSGFDGRLRAHMDGACGAQYKGWKGVRVLPGASLEDGVREARRWMADVAAGPARARAAWPLPADGPGPDAPPAEAEAGAAEDEDDHARASAVYLTPESPNVLTALRPHTTYVVGGLVDRNRHKGACHARARRLGLATARLPLAEHVAMTRHSKTVMATSHVVALLLRWLARAGDWERAILDVVPARTGPVGRSRPAGGEEAEGEEAGDGGGAAASEQGSVES